MMHQENVLHMEASELRALLRKKTKQNSTNTNKLTHLVEETQLIPSSLPHKLVLKRPQTKLD